MLSQPAKARRRLRRVAIIGGGVAGLSVAHALANSPTLQEKYQSNEGYFEVSIFDDRPSLDTTAGAGIQLNGGLAILGMINPVVQQAVIEAGLPLKGVRSRASPWSDKKPFETLLELDLRKVVENAGEDAMRALIKDDELLWISIMRGSLQQALFATLPKGAKANMGFGKSLVGIVDQDDGSVVCKFADGSQAGPFDIVVGCDGVKSACKEFVETGEISVNPSKREGSTVALYSGIRIKYAVKDGRQKDEQAEAALLSQYFGNGAYCLDGTYGAGKNQPNSKCAFLIYLDDDYLGPFKKPQGRDVREKVGENADWSQDVRRELADTQATMLSDIQRCAIPDFDIAPTVSTADRFFELGVYFHNPFSLSGWSKQVKGSEGAMVVLCGDAAHAFPPFLGQGSNQALQDAYCLAEKLYQYNCDVQVADTDVSLQALLKEYESTRWPATFNIFWKSLFLGYLETGGTDGSVARFRDLFFKTMGKIGVAELVLMSAALPKI
jgi:2-polyprenyl-6-methoxyphenol hydroxylase-like FAD-dependent oxidoreductase